MPTSEDIRKRALLEDQIPLDQMTPDQTRRKDARDRKRASRAAETREQLAQLPEHLVEQMVDPKATATKREEAIARLEQYWEPKGLLNTQANADALVEGLRILNQGFTVAAVDRAIVVLREQGKLQWKAQPAAPATPAAPVAPPEPRRLDNGEPELPLNADEWTMRRASKAQLLDLSARRREGRQRPVGWVGSSF